MVNAYTEDLHFTIQEGGASDWLRVADTSLRVPDDFAEPGGDPPANARLSGESTIYRYSDPTVIGPNRLV